MGDPELRFNRMLSLLPRIFAAQPGETAIGALLRAQAAALATVDDDLMRLLHDHWIGLAAGTPPAADEPSPLERLGALLDVRRLPLDEARPSDGAAAPREDAEAYRRRLVLTAHALTRGATTPRALLSLAIATLGAAPCARTERNSDTTLAWGMPHAVRKRCPICRDGIAGPCLNRDQAVLRAEITDSPPTPAHHQQPAARVGTPFTVASDSRVIDRPVLRLTALGDHGGYCALQNRATGEIVLYAGTLWAGEQLTIQPTLDACEQAAFDSYEETATHPWLSQYPQGRAFVSSTDGRSRPASESVFFVAGSGFDDPKSRFAPPEGGEGARFGRLGSELRTPQVRPGREDWSVLTFARPDSPFDDPGSRFAADDEKSGTRFALFDGIASDTRANQAAMLFEAFSATATSGDAAGDEATAGPTYDVELEWTVRPPATFRLSIPRNETVRAAERLGAIEVLRAQVRHARAAGVRALIDFPEPPIIERHPVTERFSLAARLHWPDRVVAHDQPPRLSASVRLRDASRPADADLVLGARFNTGRFDDAGFAVLFGEVRRATEN